MADGKWITGLTATTPISGAARRVLEVRLRVVQAHIPPARDEAHADIEHVHQLRVATRRARAALDFFTDCFPDGPYRRLRKHLKQLRRAAGLARDWDVFLQTWQELLTKAKPEAAPGFHWLAGQVCSQRLLAQKQLLDACAAHEARYRKTAQEAVAAIRYGRGPHAKEPMLGAVGGSRLIQLLDVLEESAGGDLKNYERLHQVRIDGKRLRYALEIVAECLSPELHSRLYPRVEEMQEILGAANDSHVAAQRVVEMRDQARRYWPALWPRWRPGIEAFLRYHRRQLTLKRQQFLRFWKRWQKDQVREQFLALLPRPIQESALSG